MKLRSKLLLGFSGVVAIILIMGVVMVSTLSQIDSQSKSVDTVDSGLAEALIGQGHVLRFLSYKDPSYATQASESFAAAKRLFLRASTTLLIDSNKQLLQVRIKDIDTLTQMLDKLVTLDKKRAETDGQLLPFTVRMSELLTQLRNNIQELIEKDASARLLGFYASTTAVGDGFRDARLAARVYTMTPTPENERRALDALKRTAETIKSLDGQAVDSRNVQLVKDLNTAVEGYDRHFRLLITTSKDMASDTAAMRNVFNEITKGSVDLSASVTSSLLDNASMSRNTMLAGTVIVMLLCIIIALFLTANVLRQLGKDPGVLAELAQRVTRGDFDIDDGSPRLGVYGNLIAMVASLKENIAKAQAESERAHEQTQKAQEAMSTAEKASHEAQAKAASLLEAADRLESVANVVSSASEELSAQIEQSERGAAEQASRVAETATAMEEMNSTVLEVARNAGAAADVSTSTRQKAEAGAEIVNKVVNSIQEVQKQSGHLKTDMTTLDENAKSITQIMGVISDIADQTNLLALNAAIEAARAGEAGRGFAVVADEVRKLAEKTMASTTDVGNAIRSIQASVNQSIAQVDTSATIIEQATDYAKQSGVALNEIVAMVDSTADQVRAIATASEQQSSTSDEINRSINHVNGIATETARAMQESAQAVSELANQAQVLSQLIDNMKRG